MVDAGDMTRTQLETLLRFYAESGLDFPFEPEPTNRFGEVAKGPAAAAVPPQPVAPPNRIQTPAQAVSEPPPSAAPVPPDADVVAMARAAAASADTLDALVAAVGSFSGCNLRRSARQAVIEGGARGAPIMLVGAAPSRDDDQNATAMSGLDGIMLDKMLGSIGLDRERDSYAGFCVPWAVPGGEPPTPLHLRICAPFIARQIELAGPRIVVALGNVAARDLMAASKPITRLRGTWVERAFGNRTMQVTALYDPAFLRAQPRMKRHAWLDLLALKARLAGL